jgi:hypothetical protein
LVARVIDGDFQTLDRKRFSELTVGDPLADVNRLADTQITDQEIARVTDALPDSDFKIDVVRTLRKHKGQTWREAVDAHAKGSIEK